MRRTVQRHPAQNGRWLVLAGVWAMLMGGAAVSTCKADEPTPRDTERAVEVTATTPSAVRVGARVVGARRVRDDHWGFGHSIVYLIALTRSDVPEDGTEASADARLRPKLLYVQADGVGKTMCDRPRRPHACELRVVPDVPEPTRIGLEVTFEDGVEGTVTLAVPAVPSLGEPTITSFEGSVAGSKSFHVSFRDTGAPRYRVVLQFFAGDPGHGNPFHDVELAIVERQPDGGVARSRQRHGLPGYDVEVSRHDGLIEVHAVGSEAPEGELAVLAVCGDGELAATDEVPTTTLHECAIMRYID